MDRKLIKKKANFKTQCVHAGELVDKVNGGSISPLYMATSYKFSDVKINRYPRYFNTPNQKGLADKIAALEGAEAAILFSSGMAAISTSLLSYLKSGDHVILQNDLYGGTRNFIKTELPKFGIEFTFTSGISSKDFEKEIRKNTKVIYVETPSNPKLKIIDLKSIGDLAINNKILTIIDNTFASPVNQNPLEFGFDIVIHSATKYLGGHSDISAGTIVSSKTIINNIFSSAKNFGGNLSDYTVWLLERSLKTLYLRVKEQNKNALQIANFLENEAWIDKVYYPGLTSHPNHELAKKQMKDFGGMLSFDLSPKIDCKKFLLGLELIKPTMSLAGIETTALSPKLTSHSLLTDEERIEQGINDQMVRLSAGIEDYEDLKDDIIQSIKKQI